MDRINNQNVFYTGHMPVPFPKKYIFEETDFRIIPIITAPQEYLSSATVLRDYLKRMYGFCAEVRNTDNDQGIRLVYDPSFEKEQYKVKSKDGLVEITASSAAGFSHGGSTVLQLAAHADNDLYIHEYEIEDEPDLEWRGFMVDLARGQYSLADIQKYADICYYYRLGTLHLHFADGPGTYMYYLPSKHFPNLNSADKYTDQEIQYINQYLVDRGITLIPEIEMPGHAEPLTNKYPEIFGGNHSGQVCTGMPKVFDALETLIDEVCELFPSTPYIHIGCDEVSAAKWEKCEHCCRFMEENELASAGELYSYMVNRCTRMVLAKGRTPIVWEGFPKEGTEDISKDVIVMVFQSTYQNAKELTDAGFRVINTSWQPLYIVPSIPKYWQSEKIYDWEYKKWLYENAVDDSEAIVVEKTELVLGGEICLWEGKDYQRDGDVVENNMAALAERLWNRKPIADYNSYASEKNNVSEKLKQMFEKNTAE